MPDLESGKPPMAPKRSVLPHGSASRRDGVDDQVWS